MKVTNLLKVILPAMLLVSAAQGQMVGNSIFLKGAYIEMGIGPGANFATDTSAPAGYHARPITSSGTTYACSGGSGTSPMGLLADPDMDGWATGTPPFFGDFFLPGTPFEGWAIQSDTQIAWVNGNFCYLDSNFSLGLTGANTGYSTSGSSVSGAWQGMFDSLAIKQVTTLDTNALYFTTHITVTNMSSVAKNNIYYYRFLDPDNEQQQTGSYVTMNKIEYQQPNALNASVVSARGDTFTNAYYALGSTDTNAKCLFSNWCTRGILTLDSIFNQTSTCIAPAYYNPLDSVDGDLVIGLVFRVAHLASLDSAADSVGRKTTARHPANSMSFTFFGSFAKPATDSAIKHLTAHPPIDTTLSIASTNEQVPVTVFPNPHRGTIQVTGLTTGDELSLYDMMGKQVMPTTAITHDGTSTFSLPPTAGPCLLIARNNQGAIKARFQLRGM